MPTTRAYGLKILEREVKKMGIRKRRKRKYITIKIYCLAGEVYINNNRELDEFREREIMNLFWKEVKREI